MSSVMIWVRQEGYAARFREGVWRIMDPKITLASVASMTLGAALAAHDGPVAWGWLALCALGIFGIEAGKNAAGECVDWHSGADAGVAPEDRSPFSGGKRVLVDLLLTPEHTMLLAWAGFGLGLASGLAIFLWREPQVVWVGVAGIALAWAYHGSPVRLSYRGLGELAVVLVYGPLIAGGTYLVQRGSWPAYVTWSAVPLGLLIGAFLWINEFPDARADSAAGKRTLVVRIGRPASAMAFLGLQIAGFAGLAALPWLGAPPGAPWGLVGLPAGLAASGLLLRHPDHTPSIIPAQALTLVAFLLAAVGSAAGIVMTGS